MTATTSNNLARFERYLQYRTDIVRTTYVQVLVLYYIKTKIRYNNEVKHEIFFKNYSPFFYFEFSIPFISYFSTSLQLLLCTKYGSTRSMRQQQLASAIIIYYVAAAS